MAGFLARRSQLLFGTLLIDSTRWIYYNICKTY